MGVSSIQNNYDTKTITHNYTDASDDTLVSMTYTNNTNSIEHTLREDKKHNIVGSSLERSSGTSTSTVENAYVYDGLNRLISETETIGANVKTNTYTYDAGGNILSKTDGSSTTTYHYENDWKDQLSRITVDGVNKYFTYDANGNPTRYMTSSKTSTVNMEWTRGRMLSRCNGTSFTYYANGLRKSKINSNLTQTYYYAGDTLIGEVWSNGLQITYIYGKMGIELMRVKSGSKEKIFKYVTDCLGSVIEIKELVDGALESRLKCSYDAWGNITVSGGTAITIDGYSILMSNLNPFYYRGYYYDVETNLFLVTSRYYSPELGRFIQPADVSTLNPSSINGLNLYSYANNNPIIIAYRSSGASGGMANSIGFVKGLNYGNNLGNISYITFPSLYDTLGSASNLFAVLNGIKVAKYLTHVHGNPPKVGWFLDKLSKYGKISGYLGYAAAAVDGINVYMNTNDIGLAGWTVAYDIGSMIISSKLGGLIGGLIGGPAGAIIGTLAGIGIEMLIQYFKDDVVNWVDKKAVDFYEWISNIWGELVNA